MLLRSIIKSLRQKCVKSQDAVAVTASTGIAACNIGGVTLHSFGGVGLGQESAAVLAEKVKRNAKANSRWMRTKVLIIDESEPVPSFVFACVLTKLQVSMLEGDFFDKLETVARTIRGKPQPFGGIQVRIIF